MSLFVDIEKNLGSFHLKVGFETENGVLALLGASGCGKSMTLKCIAGIEKPDTGRILLDGVPLFDSEKRINLPPQKRHVGYLFQQYALFPNMNVRQNISAGIRDKSKQKQIVEEAVRSMHLSGLEEKKPHQLSGGQQQRVALARILVNQPKVLLLDEPFSALDSHLRFTLEQEVQELIREFGKTVILVSHNRDEAYRLSERIAVMSNGHVENIGSRKELFANPETCNSAILTGCKNISPIEKISETQLTATRWGLRLQTDEPIGNRRFVGIRMHDLEPSQEGENTFLFTIVHVIENPFSEVLLLKAENAQGLDPLAWETEKEFRNRQAGDRVYLRLPKDKLMLLKE